MVSALEYFKDEVLADKTSPLFNSTKENIFGKKKRKKSIFSPIDTSKTSAIDYFASDIYDIPEEKDEDERTTLQYTQDVLQDIAENAIIDGGYDEGIDEYSITKRPRNRN